MRRTRTWRTGGSRFWPGLTAMAAAWGILQLGISECGAAATLPGVSQTIPKSLPPPTSPIDYFRELLGMSGPEREKRLATKPEAQRQYLLGKLKEFEAMPPKEREQELATASLRWYLRPLMELPQEKRREKLMLLPAENRALIEERLQAWDRLPAELQKEVLENDWMMQYVVRFEPRVSGSGARGESLPALGSRQVESEAAGLARWQAMPPAAKERIYEHFHRFFELPREEQAKTLHALSPGERQHVEQMMAGLQNLPPEQRDRCLEALRKFTQMSAEDRAQFLRNAQRWAEMKPRERMAWRQLVSRVPPLPPGALHPVPGAAPLQETVPKVLLPGAGTTVGR